MAERIFGTLHPFFEGGPVYGRKVANEGFMEELLRQDPFDSYRFYPVNTRDFTAQAEKRSDLAAIRRGAVIACSRQNLLGEVREMPFYCMHFSDPVTEQVALCALRNCIAPRLFPVTSLNHTLDYLEYSMPFLRHLWPGATRCDVIAATSRASADLMREYFRQLRENYRLSPDWGPDIRIIPLGVKPEDLPCPDDALRREARAARGFARDEVMLLLFGRIALGDKMDVEPVLPALRRVKEAEPDLAVCLVVAGSIREGDQYVDFIRDMAKGLGVDVRFELNPGPQDKRDLFAAADIFISPVDNIQETFGLTLIEAGAAGLPVVASDWDGYRDLVEDGVTGILVPTLASAHTPWLDSVAHALGDIQHQMLRGQRTVLDVPALAEAVRMLARNPERRRVMGLAGRDRVLARYTWRKVVRQWLELWEDLNGILRPEEALRARGARHPPFSDMGRAFAGYASELLPGSSSAILPDNRAGALDGGAGEGAKEFRNAFRVRTSARGERLRSGKEEMTIWLGVEQCIHGVSLRKLLTLARHPIDMNELFARMREKHRKNALPSSSEEALSFTLLWCLKHDLLEKM